MNEMNNIPEVNESWLQAEKMLDRHFRRKRALVWLFAFLIPAVIGVTAYFAWNRNADDNNISSSSQSEVVSTSSNVTSIQPSQRTVISSQSQSSPQSLSNNLAAGIVEQNHSAISHSNKTSESGSSPVASVNHTQVTHSNGPASNRRTGQYSLAAVGLSNAAHPSLTSTPGDRLPNEKNSLEPYSPSYIPSQTSVDHSEIFAMNSISISQLETQSPLNGIPGMREVSPRDYYPSCEINWLISAYGGLSYVTKQLSSSNDWNSYIDQRKNEEENVMKLSFGVMLSASIKKFSLSLGAEYADYGEKTNYSPYSMQNTTVENGNWNIFYVTEQDTDTTYITGNQFFTTTTVMRQDSAFNSHIDTVLSKQYDQFIASHNGVNHIIYFEVPVMISYNVVSGRAGVGVSAGLSPGWLTSTSGYYIKSNGRGIESLEQIDGFRKFMLNGRFGLDFYYRMSARMCLNVRPQVKANLNSVFEDSYGVSQKYTSAGVLFGVSWLLK